MLDLAAPIAQAMGALHQIERSGAAQVGPNAQAALSHIQSALAQLQAHPPQNLAVAAALEAVAGALGTVHALTRAGAQAVVQPAPAAQGLAFQPTMVAPPERPAPAAQPARAPNMHPSQAQHAQSPAPQAKAPQWPAAQPATAQAPFAPQRGAPPTSVAADGGTVTAELGAHSPSNFYKGLSGNDIIDHGGLFVSTYRLPKIGQPVRVRVSLPGGYEFEANAVVRWRREPSDAGNDAPPGFGAQFTEITAEARQLVYRYVRNREPLFHDDL
jgi:PilZ domain-containing protein